MSSRQSLRALIAALVVSAFVAATLTFTASAQPAKGAPAKPAAAAAAKGNADAGKAVYKTKCVACHKVDGTGGFKVTGNPTPNWTLKKTWDATRTDDYLRDCIVNGKVKSGMVAWGKTKQLTPAQIEDMIAYIKTFKAAAK